MEDCAVPDWLNVSRETKSGLLDLLTLVLKWNRTVNLVSAQSATHAWERHVLDCAQLSTYFDDAMGVWCDIGSGGGFPGLVLATVARAKAPDLLFQLVESDQRKATFLHEAARVLRAKVTVVCDRAENMRAIGADVVSARALADLPTLLMHAKRHLLPSGLALFMKGDGYRKEIDLARKDWVFDCVANPSKTNPRAAVLAVRNIGHV